MKDFLPLSMGSSDLPEGEGMLSLRAIDTPGESVADVRWLELRRRKAGE